VPTGLDHGTVTAVAHHRGFEVTTLRRDVATDGRHATVAFTDDFRQDAARRDFTINAMSMTPRGEVFDYFDGIADLRAGRVRFVGSAATRIAEDYLRILRFFRFWARYGTAVPDAEATAAIAEAVPGLARLSAERVWSELKRILAAPDPRAAVALMHRLGVLAAVLPEGVDPARLAELVAAGAPAEPLLRLAALLDGDAAVLAERLRLSLAERDRLLALRAAPAPPPDADDAALRRALADTPREVLVGRVWLAGGTTGLLERLAALPVPTFLLRGRDLAAAGMPAGPEMGALLQALRDWWLAGGCTGDVGAELARRLCERGRDGAVSH
jgi:poly(A) polymerase/tRNA nucleotidyltransferase (CCA-adding enzyme)